MTARKPAEDTCEAAGGTGCGCGYEPYDTGAVTVRRYFCERDVTAAHKPADPANTVREGSGNTKEGR